MDQFEKALACKTLAPLRHELFEKGKRAEIGEVREWKGQKVRKTANGWVPVTDGKQKSNQEEPSTETKEQPKDLATLARSASDAALKVAAQGPNEEVRIAAKKELERRKSEGSDVFEAPKGEETPQSEPPKDKVSKPETSKAKSDPAQSIKDMYQEDGDLVAVASCYHWLERLGWEKLSKKEYAKEIPNLNEDIDYETAMLRYADVMVVMSNLGKDATLKYIKSIVEDQSELEDYNIIDKERSADSNKKLSSKDPSSKEGVEEFLKANFFRTVLGVKLDLEYTITENPETGKLVVSSNRDIGCEKNVTSLNNNGAFEWGNIKGGFDCSGCTKLTSLEGAPKEVEGGFDCRNCTSLTSLTGAPKEVEKGFYCDGCTSLTSLEGAPKEVEGEFDCSGCTSLTSLEGAPKEVGWDFVCKNVGRTFKPSEIRKICNVGGKVKLK